MGIPRRKAAQITFDELVKVNGEIIKEPWFNVEDTDEIEYLGKKNLVADIVKKSSKKSYYLFHKPVGVLTTMKDSHGRKTIRDILDENKITETLFHVGRLDLNTSGIIMLTNDGELANKLMHPSHEITKTYKALIRGNITREEIKQLENGVFIDDYKTKPAKIEQVIRKGSNHEITLTINEGKKRQIRRMFDAIGHKVIKLKRIKFGPWKVSLVPYPGNILKLDENEIKKIKGSD